MTVDREQIQRDVESLDGCLDNEVEDLLRNHCLGLLAELEQAEKGRDDATDAWQLEIKRALDAESRLAKVPALVEAMRRVAGSEEPNWEGVHYVESDDYAHDQIRHLAGLASAALAEWERE